MRMKKKSLQALPPTLLIVLLSVASLFGMSGYVFAGPIIQDQGSGWIQIKYADAIGQSFTAEDASISTIGISVGDGNDWVAPNDFTLDYYLYEGSGFGGSLLHSTSFTGLYDGFSDFADVDFSSVNLNVGSLYTIRISNENARWGVNHGAPDVYAGGNAFYFGGAYPGNDLRFRVLPAATVPEPSTLLLLGTGLLGLVGIARRRKG